MRLKSSLLVGGLWVFALLGPNPAIASTISSTPPCVRHPSELQSNARLSALIEDFGGLHRLQGIWKFNGILGIGRSKIIFQSRANGFMARLGDSEFKYIRICLSHRADEIRIEIEDPETPEDAVVLVRKGDDGDLKFAANKSAWKFYAFQRASDPQHSPFANTNATKPFSVTD